MTYTVQYILLCNIVRQYFIDAQINYDHGYDHALAVVANARMGLLAGNYTPDMHIVVTAASLLHDVDDRKVAPHSVDYQYARQFLDRASYSEAHSAAIIECIKLTSASVNGNNPLPSDQQWKLLVRDADRLEAIGMIGIRRALTFTLERGEFIIMDDSLVATSAAELATIDLDARFAAYQLAGRSRSMFDHVLDKLLIIGQLSSGNATMQAAADSLIAILTAWYFAQCAAWKQSGYGTTKVPWFSV